MPKSTVQPSILVRLSPKTAVSERPSHHVGSPPTSFLNPWPSFRGKHSLGHIFSTRFSRNRNFVPVPSTRDELVPLREPDWGVNKPSNLRATWIGHASFLAETAVAPGKDRGVRMLLDPVFAERVGPWGMVGPRRFSPTPCRLEDLPEVDAVVISHNHYDHLDVETVKALYASRKDLHFFCALNTKSWFVASGVAEKNVTELDWWDSAELEVKDVGTVKLTCTPAQHTSGRGISDHDNMLWCSWVIEETATEPLRKLYFAGDSSLGY
jgi:N-acyl-phosphatidylethanolamine-hydrolysing phospholipase D